MITHQIVPRIEITNIELGMHEVYIGSPDPYTISFKPLTPYHAARSTALTNSIRRRVLISAEKHRKDLILERISELEALLSTPLLNGSQDENIRGVIAAYKTGQLGIEPGNFYVFVSGKMIAGPVLRKQHWGFYEKFLPTLRSPAWVEGG
ncbi:hypothetical protein ABW19_dt0208198 [Dactylella cylindrospora]|nr:hypothetical protein ABW19_dt0208198 [Dactylella cylindrospora]